MTSGGHTAHAIRTPAASAPSRIGRIRFSQSSTIEACLRKLGEEGGKREGENQRAMDRDTQEELVKRRVGDGMQLRDQSVRNGPKQTKKVEVAALLVPAQSGQSGQSGEIAALK